jgi:protein gp37
MNAIARRSLRLLLCLAIGLALQLNAATAKDIQGDWVVDGPATWDAMKTTPQIAAMPPEQQKMMQEMFTKQMSAFSATVTADKIVSTTPDGKTDEETYKVLAIEGDVVKTENTNAAGKVEKTNIQVKGANLVLTNPDQPGMTMVLKRKPATEAAPK